MTTSEAGDKVYLVQHIADMNGEYEDVKLIGVFRSQSAANAAVKALREKPGFDTAKKGFSVEEFVLDQCDWKEGFVIVDNGEPKPR
jgi:hypothetical protein